MSRDWTVEFVQTHSRTHMQHEFIERARILLSHFQPGADQSVWGNEITKTDPFFICPEFGPPPFYMPLKPFTEEPLVDLWDVNLFMMNLLKENLPTWRPFK